jgi:hypothetical protein
MASALPGARAESAERRKEREMETMRERIARATSAAYGYELTGDLSGPSHPKSKIGQALSAADAILNILSEPGEEVVDRVADDIHDSLFEGPISPGGIERELYRQTARAAIAAFLSTLRGEGK